MDGFPPEILHKVFIRLELSERLLCTLVCRSWWRVLDSYSLLYNVKIRESQQFKRFMDMIKRWPHRATQVEDLLIDCCCFEDDFNKRELSNIFPNLRIIDLYCHGGHSRKYHNPGEPMETTQTTSKIQRISDSRNCEYASQMMTYNLCGQLRTLDLNFKDLHISCHRILPQMKNMPVLKKLTLIRSYLGAADLELLHNNIPSIEELELRHLNIRSSEVPPTIMPAMSLLDIEFNIKTVDNLETHAEWYHYASKKYTNTTKWSCFDPILEEMGDAQLLFLFENGYLRFLALFAPTQFELSVNNLPRNTNVFEFLYVRDCRIKNLSLRFCIEENVFHDLALSNQSNCVEKLTLDNPEIGSFHHFQHFTALTELYIDNISLGYSENFDLTDCLNSLPDTLKKLSINCDNLGADPINCKITSIEKLEIHSKCITRNIVNTVLSCFPQLVDLTLSGSILSTLNVTLHSQFLKYVRFCIYTPAQVFAYKCPTQPKPLYYLLGNGKKTCVKYEDVKNGFILSVVSLTKRTWEFSHGTIRITQDD